MPLVLAATQTVLTTQLIAFSEFIVIQFFCCLAPANEMACTTALDVIMTLSSSKSSSSSASVS